MKYFHYNLSDNKVLTVCTEKDGNDFKIGYSIFSENTQKKLSENGNVQTHWVKKEANNYAKKRTEELNLSFNIDKYLENFGKYWCNMGLYEILALLSVLSHLNNNTSYNYIETFDEIIEIIVERYDRYFNTFNEKFVNDLFSMFNLK